MINALRFRAGATEDWRLIRFASGSGRFLHYQGLSGPASLLTLTASAMRYVLTGFVAPNISEASLHMADDSGRLWIIDRRPGSLRILRDGEMLTQNAEQELSSALTDDASNTNLEVDTFRIEERQDRLTRIDTKLETSPQIKLHDLLSRQILQLSGDCAKELGLPQLTDDKILLKLLRDLEPLHVQYREIARQYKALTTESKDDAVGDSGSLEKLETELGIIEEIAKSAEILLTPGLTMKGLKEELDAIETNLSRTRDNLGIIKAGELGNADFRPLIDLLCRIEAQARLIRFAQGSRKFYVQRLEPIHKQYLDTLEAGIVTDRQIVSELEEGFHQLIQGYPRTSQTTSSQTAQKSWFERLRSKSQDGFRDHEDSRGIEQSSSSPSQTAGDFDNTKFGIEFTRTRLLELEDHFRHVREQKNQNLKELEEAHEDLLKGYNSLKTEWQALARSHGLEENLSLEQLIATISKIGEISTLEAKRTQAIEKIRAYQSALTTVERLILEWRQKTISQKTTNLSTPSLLIAEARDIIRYRESKKKRLESLKERASERLAEDTLKIMLRSRRQDLLEKWRSLFDTHAIATPPPIHHDGLQATFKRAALIRGLGLAQTAAHTDSSTAEPRIFSQIPNSAINIFIWTREHLDNRARLNFLEELEAAEETNFRLLFVADEPLGHMLASLGVGMGHETPAPKTAASSTAPRPQELGLTLPRPSSSSVSGSSSSGVRLSSSLHPNPANDKAMQALSVLTSRRGS